MSIVGKNLRDAFSFARLGIILIVLMGIVRFIAGVSGVPYEKATHLVSLTVLVLVLAAVYGQRARAKGFGSYRHLLAVAFALAAPMYAVIITAILVEGLTGLHGYFHAPGQGLMPAGMDLAQHVVGQLIAMLGTTLFLWGIACLGFALSRHLGFLRNALLLLAAMAVVRVLVGAIGVPYSWGTWPTSLTLLVFALSFYYGYRAPASGFVRYKDAIVFGSTLAVFVGLLVVYGILVTEGLGVPSYFHSPGEGFQPEGISVGEHVAGHLRLATPVGMVLMSLVASAGLFLGKRRALAPASQAA